MNDRLGKNMAVSVRDRLLDLARERGEDFQLILTRYGMERLLYRIGKPCGQVQLLAIFG